jgi:hypothetical protein
VVLATRTRDLPATIQGHAASRHALPGPNVKTETQMAPNVLY